MNDNNNWLLAERYVQGCIPADELVSLHKKLELDAVFAADFQEHVNLILSLEGSGKQKRFRNLLIEIQNESRGFSQKIRTISLKQHYIRTGVVAASIALLTTLTTVFVVTNSEKKRTSQYSLLKREMETIKRSQNALIQSVSNKQTNNPTVAAADYAGTGFALTNDGYIVTNYHVTEGADSVYIQSKSGEYYKAKVVASDAKTDVAILKIDSKNFKFGKADVPYTFAATKRNIGARVYTLGFPQDDIVYNEGYISSRNGFMGDSMQYSLELPANPGQSGAPVVDAKGNVIGIVTGKETETEGRTYAVSTKAIYDLLSTIDEDITMPKVNKLGNMSREDQLLKLQNYTCSVKVYKR